MIPVKLPTIFYYFQARVFGLDNKGNIFFLEQRGRTHTHIQKSQLPHIFCCELISYVLPIIIPGEKQAHNFILVRVHSAVQSAKMINAERWKAKEQLRIIDTSLSLKGIYSEEFRSTIPCFVLFFVFFLLAKSQNLHRKCAVLS